MRYTAIDEAMAGVTLGEIVEDALTIEDLEYLENQATEEKAWNIDDDPVSEYYDYLLDRSLQHATETPVHAPLAQCPVCYSLSISCGLRFTIFYVPGAGYWGHATCRYTGYFDLVHVPEKGELK